jgi:plasmid stabilization system protein ParE
MTGRRGKESGILWSQRARTDLDTISAFIARDDEDAAGRWIGRLMLAVERAASLPLSGRMVPEFGREDLREILLKNYRMVYWVREDGITVVTVFEDHRLLETDPAHDLPGG